MKFIGIMLIFLSGTLCGTSAAAGLLRRTRRLQSIELMLTEINTEIKFCRKNLLQIFCDMKTRQSYLNLGFLSTLDTDECDSFEKLWSYSIENDTALCDDEKTVLLPLGVSLGATDIEGQSAALSLALEKISSMLEYERARTPEKARLYMSMGVLCGAALAVLMI
ncbi:MAG: stage III sporulation protein AB [Oscillospiraceae bacterium]|nr:stage III sporulation protein AB [Oscillospiraceae bacterium]